MSDSATSWARDMGRTLNLKPTTRYVLLTLANEAGTRSGGFWTFQEYLAADCGLSLSALKSHMSVLRKARLVISGDPRLVAGFPANARPNVYRLNLDIDPDVARTLLDPVDNPEETDSQNLDPQNLTPQTPESRGITDSQNLAPQTAGISRFDRRNLATNPLKGVGGSSQPRPASRGKVKTTDDGKRLCLECMTKQPMESMVQAEDGRWSCERHVA